ncbi:armadillo-like helical domain-containing protein 4 [Ochotona curzoniae]|uniref:armadillo-like helical domain-containing protein 4 n=1 Tax=Ochotona curzoniae TaxID=130825 RepID=UPI001B34A2C8|nr:armadillo-like helical domain-containing protein 4 [Ochotona curzoniae]
MSKPVILYIYLACSSLLLVNLGTQCLAFPQRERREAAHGPAETGQLQGTDTDDLENSSIASQKAAQLVVSRDPVMVSEGLPATSWPQVFSLSHDAHPPGAGLLHPSSSGVYSVTEPEIQPGEEVFGSRQPAEVSPGSLPSQASLRTAGVLTDSLMPDEKEEEPFGATRTQPSVEGTPAARPGFLDDKATQSLHGLSLGRSPSLHRHTDIQTTDIQTTHLRTEESEADDRMASFPPVTSAAGTEPGGLMPTAKHTQPAATQPLLTASEGTPSVEPDVDSLPGALHVPESVSTAAPADSVSSDEWDDTRGASQIGTPELGDETETQVRVGASQTVQVSPGPLDGGYRFTDTTEEAQGLPGKETRVGTVRGAERSAFTGLPSVTPTSLVEDTKAPAVNLWQSAGDITEATREDGVVLLSQTTASVSEYGSQVHQPSQNTLKDFISPETTTDAPEAEATFSLVTPGQGPGDSKEPEEGHEATAPTSDVAGVPELSLATTGPTTVLPELYLATTGPTTSMPELSLATTGPTTAMPELSLATTSSTTAMPELSLATTGPTTARPLSMHVTPAVEDLTDLVTRPNEEFTPVLDSPVTTSGVMVGTPSIFPTLPALVASLETSTAAPPSSRANTAASYGLDQLESEEIDEEEDEEDEDEEDEEEEDEEEDEDDKDADSLDESLDGDTELPVFTVPGVTSQEPGLEQDNMGPMEGATYQVPDAIEWRQQNQGLVRSWMEKLKDKAGYMSGMLVPVGVGIAGALFILGALYSIKVMNRRRRNGFKRHKRKQREFNSMQDRVMLLADSSEDEF